MAFSILPTNIGGVGISGILGPLSSLLAPKQQINNLMYPFDLGTNPAMGHAVVIQAYDYSTGLVTDFQNIQGLESGTQNAVNSFFNAETLDEAAEGTINAFKPLGKSLLSAGVSLISAPKYKPVRAEKPLATVSLFMPDTLNIQYNATYSEVSLTQELGIAGFAANAYADQKTGSLKAYGITGMTQAAQKVLGAVGIGNAQDLGALGAQGAGIVVNPQIQLLFKAVALRTFQLEFMLTPKTSKEAETVKNICDTLAFYALPGLGGSQLGQSGQFLTPPQIFKIDFKFLGQTGVVGNISNILSSALSNSGLGFLTSGTDAVQNGQAAKIFSVNECVLKDVSVDYAPNGWATYNDGYPIQTRLTLQFMEMEIPTKDSIKNAAVAGNYNATQYEKSDIYQQYKNTGEISPDGTRNFGQ